MKSVEECYNGKYMLLLCSYDIVFTNERYVRRCANYLIILIHITIQFIDLLYWVDL